MKKPLSKWAIALWIIAALIVLGQVIEVLSVNRDASQLGIPYLIWTAVRPALVAVGQVAGLGALIELVDKIRWDSLHRRD